MYVQCNNNKSIYYYSFSANQNDVDAQYTLGFIYYDLGFIYYNGQYVPKDIKKAIYYSMLASNQNDPESHFYFGLIYLIGKYVPQIINKAIHYFSLASNLNDGLSQLYLGCIYFQRQGFNKVLHYLSLASNENCPSAQYFLGLYYYDSQFTKAIYWLLKSSILKLILMLDIFYHEGKYIKMDIKKQYIFIKMHHHLIINMPKIISVSFIDKTNSKLNITNEFYDGFELE